MRFFAATSMMVVGLLMWVASALHVVSFGPLGDHGRRTEDGWGQPRPRQGHVGHTESVRVTVAAEAAGPGGAPR